jgi:hypothetical protein
LNHDALVGPWERLITGPFRTWVVFEHGTCVVLRQPQGNPAEQARALLTEWGPVHVGSPAGDFNVRSLRDLDGWLVTFDHPDILTYVGPLEVQPGSGNVVVGLLGRKKRADDARDLKVIQIHGA